MDQPRAAARAAKARAGDRDCSRVTGPPPRSRARRRVGDAAGPPWRAGRDRCGWSARNGRAWTLRRSPVDRSRRGRARAASAARSTAPACWSRGRPPWHRQLADFTIVELVEQAQAGSATEPGSLTGSPARWFGVMVLAVLVGVPGPARRPGDLDHPRPGLRRGQPCALAIAVLVTVVPRSARRPLGVVIKSGAAFELGGKYPGTWPWTRPALDPQPARGNRHRQAPMGSDDAAGVPLGPPKPWSSTSTHPLPPPCRRGPGTRRAGRRGGRARIGGPGRRRRRRVSSPRWIDAGPPVTWRPRGRPACSSPSTAGRGDRRPSCAP